MRVGRSGAGSVPLWNAISAPPSGEDVRPSGEQLPERLEPALEQRDPVAVVEPERGELVLDRFLGDVPGARAEDRPTAGEHVERRPGVRELQGPALRGDEACRPELHPGRPLRQGGEHGERLVARLREEAVADPERVEPERLRPCAEREQIGERVVRRDQRLAVVQVEAEPQHSLRPGARVAAARARARPRPRRRQRARPGPASAGRSAARRSAARSPSIPLGTASDGCPVTFVGAAHTVSETIRSSASTSVSRSSGSGRAVCGTVGESSTS